MGGSAGGQRVAGGGAAQGGMQPAVREFGVPRKGGFIGIPEGGDFAPPRRVGPEIPPNLRQQPNIYQQSAQSVGQAQRTMGGLSRFSPQQMRAAGASPTATFGGAQLGPTTTYGGATVESTMLPQAAQLGAVERYAGANIDPIERARSAQLGPAQTMQGVGAVRAAQAPDQIAVDRLRTTDISSYMNPFEQQVVEAGQRDIERQRQMASENLAAQADRAKAFGGSRQAVQEGVLAGEAVRQAKDLSSRQRQAGFQQAVESGKFDIGTTQQARTLASQQGFQASQLGQQAREAAANRDQAARAGNMQAANQFAQQQAQLEQQATLANQAAFNARAKAQAGLQQQAGLASMQAANQFTTQQAQMQQQANMAAAAQEAARASQQAGLTQQAGLSSMGALNQAATTQAGFGQQAGLANQAAMNQAIQAQAARQQAANQANFGGQFTGAGIQQGAASGLAGLGQQQFGMGQDIQQQQMQQGAMQQNVMQQLIGAGQQNFGHYGAPTGGLNTLIGGLTGAGVPTGTTSQYQPGFLNYLQTAAMLGR